jgi:small multidrug resistance family-3 protein
VPFALAGAVALAGYGAVAGLQPDALRSAACFIVGSPAWGVIFDGLRSDRFESAARGSPSSGC